MVRLTTSRQCRSSLLTGSVVSSLCSCLIKSRTRCRGARKLREIVDEKVLSLRPSVLSRVACSRITRLRALPRVRTLIMCRCLRSRRVVLVPVCLRCGKA